MISKKKQKSFLDVRVRLSYMFEYIEETLLCNGRCILHLRYIFHLAKVVYSQIKINTARYLINL